MSHIFISYSRKDLDLAQKIVDALATNDLDTWIDWKSIPKGEDWEQAIDCTDFIQTSTVGLSGNLLSPMQEKLTCSS